MTSGNNNVLVYGGKGALGSALVAYLQKQQMRVVSVDIMPNEDCKDNVLVDPSMDLQPQGYDIEKKVGQVLGEEKLSAIYCVAGGWAGGNANDDDMLKNAELMIKQSLYTSLISARLAAKFLAPNGLVVLTGAKASLGGTSFMMGYGATKAAVHQLTQSMAAANNGLPENTTTLAIAPVTLDTPMNRKFMADADFTTWTSLEFVCELLHEWSTAAADRPESGSIVQLITKDNETRCEV
ncbi:hypothetical protein SARC_10628 [Sphaeroforma arctica JP610]|uniref:Dihydropteridine reductase n=1 Tax=Sphaeroforma arctica JP610 TaxID=667725 RepID=A0A0L0FJD3_9EUKA|nr:hypothetical protein SARC_10628 [Sphaeroforma arctica JP610]KNC76897.1 hypothetical protein SARC_10628 [Sphaeroforma arctica JP610]|eukprot:XP_014150799.1 hypothetical protein SARC_10628 [Sphaeroforma arctica JP610]